jgi:electron transport complex protein RnfD
MDARTQATPLAWAKQALKTKQKARDAEDQAEADQIKGQGQAYAKTVNGQLKSTLVGNVAGCLGETSALALLAGGIYLLIRKTISIHIPAAVLLTTLLFSSIVYEMNPETSITPLSHLCNGGLLLCAFFIATDPVTAPLTKRGMWIFGAGVGALIMLIRVVGEYPEGVMFAVLLMNAVTPLIDRLCKRIPAGGKPDV